jgi:hypothetical protein
MKLQACISLQIFKGNCLKHVQFSGLYSQRKFTALAFKCMPSEGDPCGQKHVALDATLIQIIGKVVPVLN